MTSIRGQIFLALLRNRHLFTPGGRQKPITRTMESIMEFRKVTDRGAKMFGRVPKDVTVQTISIDGMEAEWIIPPDPRPDTAILYFHGGGYVTGNCRGHRAHVAKVAKGTGIAALLFTYRLAPEHPFPAAVEDSLRAYRHLLGEGLDPAHIAFMGDSAGGGLCLATLLAIREKELPLPAAAVALSPWTDLKCTGPSYTTNAKRCLSPPDSWTVFSHYYAAAHDPANPLISPLYGDLSELPPLMIFAGSDEVLRDDAIRFAEKARQAGTEVHLEIGEKLFHCYPVTSPLFPEATQAMRKLCGFIGERV